MSSGAEGLKKMSGQIFISYRRDDASYPAGRLYDRLSAHFLQNQIFIDVDNLEPGVDFVEAIEASVGSCDVLIAVIGKRWLTSSDEEGKRRLDNSDDFVRLEIATALKRNIRVIPVLVDGALMPRSSELPDDLKLLARRNALEVSHNRFNADFGRLVTAIERVLERPDVERKQPEESPTPTTQGDAEAALNRGDAYNDKKKYDKAISEYTEAIRIKPNYAFAYQRRGTAYYFKPEYDKAIRDFTEAIRLDPNDAFSYLFRGDVYHKKEQYDKAISDITEGIRLDPNDAYGYNLRGRVHTEEQEYDKAISDFTEAIRLDPNDDWAYESRGSAYESQGKLDLAKADFAKADKFKKAEQ
jgi:tetratricopeptide (TPR) repeat protein